MKNMKTAVGSLFLIGLMFRNIAVLHTQENTNRQETPAETRETNTVAEMQKENPVHIATEIEANENPVQNIRAAVPGKLFFTLGAVGILNTDKNSAPSPILFTLGAGGRFPVYTAETMYISLSPHGSYFAGYFLWDKVNKRVVPAEIEQRTAYVPSLLFDIPAVFNFPKKHSLFSAGFGAAFLLRFAARAINVSVSTSEMETMNRWFWQNARFLYFSAQLSWDYTFPSGLATGIGAKTFLAAGSLVDKRKLDCGMLMLFIRIIPPKTP